MCMHAETLLAFSVKWCSIDCTNWIEIVYQWSEQRRREYAAVDDFFGLGNCLSHRHAEEKERISIECLNVSFDYPSEK